MLHVINEKKYFQAISTMKDSNNLNIDDFLNDSSIYIRGIESGIECEDMLKVKSFAHTIHQSSKCFGAEIVADNAKKIEKMANSIIVNEGGCLSDMRSMFEELELNFRVSHDKIKKL